MGRNLDRVRQHHEYLAEVERCQERVKALLEYTSDPEVTREAALELVKLVGWIEDMTAEALEREYPTYSVCLKHRKLEAALEKAGL
jgi:broad specificity phosphatase PhoE